MTTVFQLCMTAVIAATLAGNTTTSDGKSPAKAERLLFEFDTPDSADAWTSVNDTVMGGVSSGGYTLTEDGSLRFSGEVSLENNGGFASLRARTGTLDLSAYDDLIMRVRGDGKRYEISLQTDHWIMAGAYYFAIQTKAGEWQELRAPLREFKPKSFGRALRDAPALNVKDIRGLGFIISDKQEGPFRLEIDWIKATKANEDEDEAITSGPTERNTAETTAALIEKAISLGAPMFNAGQPEACAGIYETTANCIVDLSAGNLPAEAVKALRTGLQEAGETTDPAERAWKLRRAFDASLRILESDRSNK